MLWTITAEFLGTQCYIISNSQRDDYCIIVDPGKGTINHISHIIKKYHLHPIAVLITHGHLDHTWSIYPLCNNHNIPCYIHSNDAYRLNTEHVKSWLQLSIYQDIADELFNIKFPKESDIKLLNEKNININGFNLQALHTPGHTEGSVVFSMEIDNKDHLFTGDTLFCNGIGRTDLPGGNYYQLIQSIKNVILPMNPDTIILPGHGKSTILKDEMDNNIYIKRIVIDYKNK